MSSHTDDDKVDLFRANSPNLEAMLRDQSKRALLPAIPQQNSKHLSECLKRGARLSTHEKWSDVNMLWACVGVDVERIQQRAPQVMKRGLSQVASTSRAIRQALQLIDDERSAFFRQHVYSLLYSARCVLQTLQIVAGLLAVPLASKEMKDVIIMVCGQQLFHHDPAELCRRVTFFREEFNGGQHVTRMALKQSVYHVSAETMRTRAAGLRALLGLTQVALNRTFSFTSLLNTLAPRWHFLALLEAAQAGFKAPATDNLIALATLSDEHFAQAYDNADLGLTYDHSFRQHSKGTQ